MVASDHPHDLQALTRRPLAPKVSLVSHSVSYYILFPGCQSFSSVASRLFLFCTILSATSCDAVGIRLSIGQLLRVNFFTTTRIV